MGRLSFCPKTATRHADTLRLLPQSPHDATLLRQ
nr:MAG TPA: hypothetical protein [Caudoviricetes sp.]